MATPTATKAPRRGRVLIVDDEADVRAIMQTILERNGFEVIAVDGGSDALAYMAHDTPSLVLLDLEMDDMNGWEVLTMLRKHPAFGTFKVIVVSGAEGIVPKWAGHLRKPFRLENLLAMLDEDTTAAPGAMPASSRSPSRA